eukprot:TRINITY_DN3477_c0_g1_i1.p2 TRINITY_DN3477_c0_g1~~TRINITY_DN3477_c0_g1_i1.p2  ORF type:complete len:104 (+),score=16.91 TRINITY_DN3477_c0_g1_i1:66-377(+)
MIRRPPRSTLSSSSAASDVYKRQVSVGEPERVWDSLTVGCTVADGVPVADPVLGRGTVSVGEPERVWDSLTVGCTVADGVPVADPVLGRGLSRWVSRSGSGTH